MTCKYNYKSISLRNKTMEKLEKLSVSIVQDKKLSNAKTVEYLIDASSRAISSTTAAWRVFVSNIGAVQPSR